MATFSGTSAGGTSFSNPDEWYDQYLADLAQLGGSIAQEEYQPYNGPRIAEWTPDQLQAFSMVRDASGMWEPYVQPALDSIYAAQGGLNEMSRLAMQGAEFDRPTFENTYMDIYSNPMREMQAAADSIGQRNFQNTTLKSLNDNFTGSGQFGSSRHQILGADAAAQAQTQIEEAKAGIYMDATKNAMSDYYKWAQENLQGAQQMGQYSGDQAKLGTDLMNFGLGTQQAAMADAASIGNIGQQQQTMNQQNLNMAYQDFQDQQNYPWQQLDKWSALLRGQSIPNYSSNVTLPATVPTTYTNPWASGLQGFSGGWQLGSSFSA